MILGGAPEAMEALPIGVCLHDADGRFVWATGAYAATLKLSRDHLRPGVFLADHLRHLAYLGTFGPGDPEAQAAEGLRQGRGRAARLRRRHADGRFLDFHVVSLSAGGHLTCVAEVTPLVSLREEAEAVSARLGTALESLRIGLGVFGPDRRLSLHNRRFGELLGLPAYTVTAGLTFAELLRLLQRREEYSGLDGESFLAAQLGLDRSRPSMLRRQRLDGHTIEIASEPLPDHGWMMQVADLTPLARLEDQVQRRAALLDGILGTIPQGILIFGADRRVVMRNPAYDRIMGGVPVSIGDSLEQVVQRCAASAQHRPDAAEALTAARLNAGYPGLDAARPAARRVRRSDGTTVELHAAALPDGGHIEVVTDVTSLVLAQGDSTRQAEALQAMLAHIRHGIVLWDPERRLVAANPAMAALAGGDATLFAPGRTLEDVVVAAVSAGLFGTAGQGAELARDLLEADRTRASGVEVATGDGRAIELRFEPTHDGGWVTTYTDVTAERAAAEELRQAKALAETASQAKSRFLAAMSHELRTPLNAVIGFSDALRRAAGAGQDAAEGVDAGRVAEYAEAIHSAGRQLLDRIDTILDVTRIEAGRLELAEDRVAIDHLLRTCLAQARPAAAAAAVDLTGAVPTGLPLVRGDERRLRQVVAQLIENALKFTEPGGRVAIGAGLAPSGELEITVSDTGIGLPEGEAERLFAPFVQLDNSLSRRFQGSGLGLYICRALVQAHEGKLQLASRPGEGTVAAVRLPLHRLHPVRPGEHARTGVPASVPPTALSWS